MDIPADMQMAFRGKADFIREVAEELKQAGIATVTGPLPGG